MDVCLNIFGELHCITCLSRESHQRVLVQFAGLVIGGLEDGGASHGGFGSGDEGEVLSRDTK